MESFDHFKGPGEMSLALLTVPIIAGLHGIASTIFKKFTRHFGQYSRIILTFSKNVLYRAGEKLPFCEPLWSSKKHPFWAVFATFFTM